MSFLGSVKNRVIALGGRGAMGGLLYHRIKYTTATVLGRLMGEERYAKWFYHLYTGKTLDLENPVRFDEKLWWLKLNNRNPLLTICSDKAAVRSYVAECGYPEILIPQYGVLDSVEQLDFSRYPEEVIAKCTHNSGGHIFYDPKNPPDEKKLKIQKSQMRYILRHNASVLSLEWNYKNIPPKIVVEKVLRDKKGSLPLDYKFMCFDGEPKQLFLKLESYTKDDEIYNHDYYFNIYDMDFHLLPMTDTRPNAPYPVEKPENFDRMVEIARKLSQPFPLCRVDLYNIDGAIYFGEITFYHGGGCNHIEPPEWDLKMASWVDLDSPKITRGGVYKCIVKVYICIPLTYSFSYVEERSTVYDTVQAA